MTGWVVPVGLVLMLAAAVVLGVAAGLGHCPAAITAGTCSVLAGLAVLMEFTKPKEPPR